ncbi:MAG TPA: TonB-dependent receptor [Gammaproteobacteria bacterium]|nr:TonB-dependent receptor [Gammaproteobacteria bacterium]
MLLAVSLASAKIVWAQPQPPLVGRTVQGVLDELRAAGAPFVYSSNLLPSTLTVTAEPNATDELALAREILQPHGLAVRVESGVWLVVRGEPPASPAPFAPGTIVLRAQAGYAGGRIQAPDVQLDPPTGPTASATDDGAIRFEGVAPGRHRLLVSAAGFVAERFAVEVAPGRISERTVALFEAVPKLEEVVVTASRYEVGARTEPSATYLSRDDIETVASLAGDTIRVVHHLPGIASNEFSARPYVRGGAANELAVLIDGIRLIEPYHLRDFQGVFSVVDQRIVDSVAVHAGGFPAAYGDALSALLIIEPREPTQRDTEIGLSALYTSGLSSGTFADGRASWLVSARNSNLDRVLADHIGDPAYSDLFWRVTADLGERHRLAAGKLRFRDDIVLTLENEPTDRQVATSDTNSRQSWLKLDSQWTDALSSSTWLYGTTFESSRREDVADLAEIVGNVDDHRELEVVGLKQAWQFEPSMRQLWTFGAEVEEREARFRYASAADRRGLLATLGNRAPPLRMTALSPSGNSYGWYVEDRVRVTDRLIADLGVRWDRQTYVPGNDSQFSPRASMLYRLGSKTDLRLSHGRFFQAEGLLELQVEDGVTEFYAPQRAGHSILSVERRFTGSLALRVELYRKWTRNVRPHYENLFDPLELIPELRASRVLVAPDRAESEGLEVFLSGEEPVSWWAGFTSARVQDLIDGVPVSRSWDQRRALTAGATWPVGGWSLSAAATMHRGWPTTRVTVVTGSTGDRVAVAGPRNSDRLGGVRRLDVRASREFGVGPGSLRFFAEVTNLTNRQNACCLVYDPVTLPSGLPSLVGIERARAGITGNIGLLWQF